MEWNSIISGVVSGLLSGVIVSWFFYWLSGRELRREAARLRNLTNLVLRGLEEAKLAKFNRDANGEPIGLVFERRVVDSLGFNQRVE